MDHHTLAAVSITGTCLDVVGSLYLAYDLLGGQHGPLRLLTRAVTYSMVFVVGFGLGQQIAGLGIEPVAFGAEFDRALEVRHDFVGLADGGLKRFIGVTALPFIIAKPSTTMIALT